MLSAYDRWFQDVAKFSVFGPGEFRPVLLRAQAGDARSQQEIVLRFQRLISKVVHARVYDWSKRMDLVQEMTLSIYDCIRTFRPGEYPDEIDPDGWDQTLAAFTVFLEKSFNNRVNQLSCDRRAHGLTGSNHPTNIEVVSANIPTVSRDLKKLPDEVDEDDLLLPETLLAEARAEMDPKELTLLDWFDNNRGAAKFLAPELGMSHGDFLKKMQSIRRRLTKKVKDKGQEVGLIDPPSKEERKKLRMRKAAEARKRKERKERKDGTKVEP